MANHPPTYSSMNGRHSEQPPKRASIYIIGGLSRMVLWQRGGCGLLRG
jgi:hypothetical protein